LCEPPTTPPPEDVLLDELELELELELDELELDEDEEDEEEEDDDELELPTVQHVNCTCVVSLVTPVALSFAV